MTFTHTSAGVALRIRAWGMAVFLLVIGLCVAGCSCARYDIYYHYGAVSFIDTGGGTANQMEFSPSKGADSVYLRYFSPDVLVLREMTIGDAGRHPYLGKFVESDGSLLIGRFYFSSEGKLDFLHIDGGDPGEVQVATSPDGPFVDLPMTVQTMRKTFGPPKSISYAKVNR